MAINSLADHSVIRRNGGGTRVPRAENTGGAYFLGGVAECGIGLVFALASYGIPIALLTQAGDAVVSLIAVLTSVIATVVTLAIRFQAFLVFWISLVILQNASVGLWLPDTFNGSVPLVITEMKTISLLSAVLMSLGPIIRYLNARRSVAAFAFIYVLWVLASVRGLSPTAFAYGRNFLFPLILLVLTAALTTQLGTKERLALLRRVIVFVVVVMSVGVVSEIAVGTPIWRQILNAGKLSSLGSVSETTRFFGVRIERVAGFIVEPTNAGYIAAGCAVLLVLVAIAERRRPGLAWWATLLASLWLLLESTARSGFLMLALAVVALLMSRTGLRGVRLFAASLLAAFGVVVVYIATQKSPSAVLRSFSDPLSVVGGDSTTYHFAGLLSGVQEGLSRPWGYGLGRGGNFSTSLSEGEDALSGAAKVATGGESAWGVLSYQTGVIGLILLAAFLIVLGRRWGVLSMTTLIIWSATSMFAEAAFGLQVAGLLMVGAALLRESDPTSHDRDVPITDRGSRWRRASTSRRMHLARRGGRV